MFKLSHKWGSLAVSATFLASPTLAQEPQSTERLVAECLVAAPALSAERFTACKTLQITSAVSPYFYKSPHSLGGSSSTMSKPYPVCLSGIFQGTPFKGVCIAHENPAAIQRLGKSISEAWGIPYQLEQDV